MARCCVRSACIKTPRCCPSTNNDLTPTANTYYAAGLLATVSLLATASRCRGPSSNAVCDPEILLRLHDIACATRGEYSTESPIARVNADGHHDDEISVVDISRHRSDARHCMRHRAVEGEVSRRRRPSPPRSRYGRSAGVQREWHSRVTGVKPRQHHRDGTGCLHSQGSSTHSALSRGRQLVRRRCIGRGLVVSANAHPGQRVAECPASRGGHSVLEVIRFGGAIDRLANRCSNPDRAQHSRLARITRAIQCNVEDIPTTTACSARAQPRTAAGRAGHDSALPESTDPRPRNRHLPALRAPRELGHKSCTVQRSQWAWRGKAAQGTCKRTAGRRPRPGRLDRCRADDRVPRW
jgi:hypothetical protein